jgi:type IV pilus assembly protein PilC
MKEKNLNLMIGICLLGIPLLLVVLALTAAGAGLISEGFLVGLIVFLCVTVLVAFIGREFFSLGLIVQLRLWLFPSERERIAEFYRYLARWTRLDYDLVQALTQRVEDADPAWLQRRIRRVLNRMMNGEPFSAATQTSPEIFCAADRAVIEAGEKAGNLPETFDYLAQTTRGRQFLNFPLFLVLIELLYAVAVVIFVMVLIIPKFYDIFCQLGAELPMPTVVFIQASYMICHHLIWIVLFAVVLWLMWRQIRRSPALMGALLSLVPPLRELYWSMPLSRFSFALGSLLRAGTDLPDALALATKAARNAIISRTAGNVRTSIESGKPIDEALQAIPSLPRRFLWFLGRGMKREKPDETLLALADSCRAGHETRLYAISSFVFPTFLIGFGMLALFFIVAMYLPLFCIPKVIGR